MSRPRKLDAAAERRIVILRSQGLTQTQIALRFEVSAVTIQNVLNRHLRADDEEEPELTEADDFGAKVRRGSAVKGSGE